MIGVFLGCLVAGVVLVVLVLVQGLLLARVSRLLREHLEQHGGRADP